MKIIYLVLALYLSSISQAYAVETIKMNVSENALPPFLFSEGDLERRGVFVDVMLYITKKHAYMLEITNFPRKRAELYLTSGKVDALVTARTWVKPSDDYIFTDDILTVKNTLYSLKTAPVIFDTVESLFNKTLSVRRDYSYPLFEDFFQLGEIDESLEYSEYFMLKSVLLEYSDATVLNDITAKWHIRNEPVFQNVFFASGKIVNNIKYRIMLNKDLKNFTLLFNDELKRMKANGEYQKILDKYDVVL
jgi:ABC-type amino acid transport substrate-binding protein